MSFLRSNVTCTRKTIFMVQGLKVRKIQRPLSGFLERIGPVSHIKTLPVLQLPIAPESIPLVVEFQGDVSFSANALDLYDRCPRRFLYTHLLCIGGRRQTAFMQMHEQYAMYFKH